MPLLDIKRLKLEVTVGDRVMPIVSDLTLAIEGGEIVGLVGDAIPNGFTGADSWQISGCLDLERQ